MAIKTIDTKYLSDIADAIRDKTGKTEGLEVAEMAGEIAEITGDDPFAPVSPFTYTVDAISGATYGFALRANNYYESQNKGVNSSYAICRVNLNVATACDIVFDVINYAESSFDYAVFGALDTALALSNSADTSAKENFNGRQSADVVNVTYSGVSVGEHFIDVKFIKDSSQHSNNDSVQFKIQEQGGLSQETIDKILAADSDLVAENIAEGVDIFGVVGSYEGSGGGGGGATLQVAEGTFTPTNTSLKSYPITISGLPFKPKMVYIQLQANGANVYTGGLYGLVSALFTDDGIHKLALTLKGSMYCQINHDDIETIINNDGFTLSSTQTKNSAKIIKNEYAYVAFG